MPGLPVHLPQPLVRIVGHDLPLREEGKADGLPDEAVLEGPLDRQCRLTRLRGSVLGHRQHP
jgi:hypothetical protein